MKVLFFARLRELHGGDYVELADAECPPDVDALRALTLTRVGAELAEALADPNVFCAVNQKVVHGDHPLNASDEIAFFPPMTGG